MNFELKNIDGLKNAKNWFVIIGIILIILGCFALTYQIITAILSVYVIGSLLLIAGIIQTLHSFKMKGVGQTALWAVMGVLYIITGIMSFIQPVAVLAALTLVISFLFIMSGVTQILGAFNNKNMPRWGWLLTSGIITLILGLLLIAGWPYNALWVLGMFLGIDLIFQGWAYVSIGFALKNK